MAVPAASGGPARPALVAATGTRPGAVERASTRDRRSSTPPDTPPHRHGLPLLQTLAWSGGLGAAGGALLLRTGAGGWAPRVIGAGVLRGGALGVGVGAALLGIDRATHGEVQRQLGKLTLDRRAQAWFVISNPGRPWIGPTGIRVATAARTAQESLYGRAEPLDGPQDAFRHAFAAALLSLRAMRDHGQSTADAHRLAIDAGEAHERDGQDNNDDFSREMDRSNNRSGTQLIGDGRARSDEPADAAGYVTELALRERVLDAIGGGRLQLVDRGGSTPVARPSGVDDLPRQRS